MVSATGRTLRVIAILVLLGCPLFASTENLVLILDASGSMWGRVNNETKIEMARRVVRDLVGQMPEQSKLGLVAYGHRQKGECSDIETLVAPGTADKSAVPDQVDKLNPLGMTPITRAFEQAVEAAAKVKEPGTLVLVTDGLETCGGDPCAAVRKAKQAGLDFVLHIVGFDVAKENVSSLECSAQAGGGLFIPAENAEELSAALEQTMTAEEPLGEATLSVKSLADGKLHDSIVEVFGANKKRIAAGRTYAGEETNPRLFPLAAGSYDVVVRPLGIQGAAQQRFPSVAITAGKVVEKIADFSTGELSVLVTRNGKLADATVRVLAAGTKTQVAASRSYRAANSNPRVFRLPAGDYDIVVRHLEVKGAPDNTFANATVTAGQRTELTDAVTSGTLKIGAVQGRTLVDATTNVVNAAGKPAGAGRTYTNPKSNPKVFELLPGKYTVTVKPVRLKGVPRQTVAVEVEAGETIVKTVDFAQ